MVQKKGSIGIIFELNYTGHLIFTADDNKQKYMRFDQKPVHRKLIIPWHDSYTACWVTIIIMLGIFFFSLCGISVARENPYQLSIIWIPMLLSFLSGGVALSTIIRLARRIKYRYSKESDLSIEK